MVPVLWVSPLTGLNLSEFLSCFETIFSQQGTSFRKVGLIEYPGKGLWSLVFLSTAPEGEIRSALPGVDDYVSVFLPCTPNPTTGFFVYVKFGILDKITSITSRLTVVSLDNCSNSEKSNLF